MVELGLTAPTCPWTCAAYLVTGPLRALHSMPLQTHKVAAWQELAEPSEGESVPVSSLDSPN